MIERYEEETVEQTAPTEDEVRREEEKKLAEEKPVDTDSEIVPNKNLTDDEIAQLILEEEELLSDQGLLGYIFASTADSIHRVDDCVSRVFRYLSAFPSRKFTPSPLSPEGRLQ